MSPSSQTLSVRVFYAFLCPSGWDATDSHCMRTRPVCYRLGDRLDGKSRAAQGGTQDAECRPAPAADNQDATKAHLRRSYDGLNLGFVLTLDKRSPIYAPRGPSKMVPAVTEVW